MNPVHTGAPTPHHPIVAAACSGRGVGPSTRITPLRRANPSLPDLVAMSRAMEAAHP